MVDSTDPKVFGPPLWSSIHKDALLSTTKEQQLLFVVRLQDKIRGIPCSNCRNHAQEYFDKNNIHNAIYVSILGYDPSLSIFIWTWLFHNDVNKRIGKRLLSIQEALAIHTGMNVPTTIGYPASNLSTVYPTNSMSSTNPTDPKCNQKCQRAAVN